MPFLYALIAFAAGAVVSIIQQVLISVLIKKYPNKIMLLFSVIRMIISIGFLTALFFVGKLYLEELPFIMIGGALGLTIPLYIFTARLARSFKPVQKEEKDDKEDDKEDSNGGNI